MKRILLLTLLFVIAMGYSAEAQRKASKKRKGKVKTAIVTTEDGSQLRGEIRKLTKDSLVVDTEQFGVLRYLRDEVEYIIDSQGNKAIKTNGNKYLFSTSAFPVEETYLEFTYWVPTVGFRINDYLSASVTLEPFSSIYARYPNSGASLKGSMRLGGKWYGALGINLATIKGRRSSASGSISPFATFTYGDVKNNVSGTVRLISGFNNQGSSTGANFSVSGIKRLSRRLSFIGEFHLFGGENIINENANLLILGIRKHPGSGETTYNYGLMMSFSNYIPIPYFGFSFPIE